MIHRTYQPKKKTTSHVRMCIGQYEDFKTETFIYVHNCAFKSYRVSSSSDQNAEVGVSSQQDQFPTCRGHRSLEKSFSYHLKITPGIISYKSTRFHYIPRTITLYFTFITLFGKKRCERRLTIQ